MEVQSNADLDTGFVPTTNEIKVVLNKAEFKNAIAVLSPSTKKKEGMITSCLLFDVKDGTVTIRASDRMVYTCVTLDAETGVVMAQGEGKLTLEVTRLTQWINNVSDDDVVMTLSEGDLVTMSCGSVESPFPSRNPELFTSNAIFESQFEKASVLFETDVNTLMQSLDFVKNFVSSKDDNNDPTRALQTVALRDGKFYGTDSKLISVFLDSSLGSDLKIGQEQISQVLSFLKRQSEVAPIEVLSSKDMTFLKVSEASWFGFTQPKADLPDLSKVPTTLEESFILEVEKNDLRSALGVLKATADANETRVEATLQEDESYCLLNFSMTSLKQDHPASVDIKVGVTSSPEEDLKFRFDVNSLAQVLSAFEGTISLALETNSNYLKFYQRQETGAEKVCIMSLQYA